MIKLSKDGLTAFSMMPLKLAAYLGWIALLASNHRAGVGIVVEGGCRHRGTGWPLDDVHQLFPHEPPV
jgi:hypothetical protein